MPACFNKYDIKKSYLQEFLHPPLPKQPQQQSNNRISTIQLQFPPPILTPPQSPQQNNNIRINIQRVQSQLPPDPNPEPKKLFILTPPFIFGKLFTYISQYVFKQKKVTQILYFT